MRSQVMQIGNSLVAQLVERVAVNYDVVSSSLTRGAKFPIPFLYRSLVAQLVERVAVNHDVVSSSLTQGAKFPIPSVY